MSIGNLFHIEQIRNVVGSINNKTIATMATLKIPNMLF